MYDDLDESLFSDDEPIYDENPKPNGDDIWYLFIVIMTIVAMYCFYTLKG
jgi:hypothetical protein